MIIISLTFVFIANQAAGDQAAGNQADSESEESEEGEDYQEVPQEVQVNNEASVQEEMAIADDELAAAVGNMTIQPTFRNVKLPYILYEWLEPPGNRRISVDALIPVLNGLDDVEVSVVRRGKVLRVSLLLPFEFFDYTCLLTTHITASHSMVTAFADAVRLANVEITQPEWMICKIPLPFPCSPNPASTIDGIDPVKLDFLESEDNEHNVHYVLSIQLITSQQIVETATPSRVTRVRSQATRN